MLLGLGVATILNVALNFREYSIKSAVEKATMTAAIVKNGLTAHIVNDIMNKRQYFLNQEKKSLSSCYIMRQIRGALKVAQTIKQQFSDIGFNVGEEEALHKTMSIGIPKFSKDAPSIWKCIKYADNAMYVAKTTGRDKIVLYEPTMDEDENLR